MRVWVEQQIVAEHGICHEGDSGGWYTPCPFLQHNAKKHVSHGKKGVSYTAYHERCALFKEWLEGNSVAPQCCEACLKAQASYARMTEIMKQVEEERADG